jgi:deoxyribose-phosphate aldolase
MTDSDVIAGLEISKKYSVATACVKPYHIPLAVKYLAGTSVLVCPVIGFPHGNSTTAVKVFEAKEAVKAGGKEIDMVINIGKALSKEWDYVEKEIAEINAAVTADGAILKVIFENDCKISTWFTWIPTAQNNNWHTIDLSESDIIKLCEICSRVGVAFVKTSTGYGFVKKENGDYNYKGATFPHLQLMRSNTNKDIQIKAAGGVRTLDDLLRVRALGVSRVGATATVAMLEEAAKRGIGAERIDVVVPWPVEMEPRLLDIDWRTKVCSPFNTCWIVISESSYQRCPKSSVGGVLLTVTCNKYALFFIALKMVLI